MKHHSVGSFSGVLGAVWTDQAAFPSFKEALIRCCPHCKNMGLQSDFEQLGPPVYPSVEYSLTLIEVGAGRLAVMRLIRSITDCSLAEAKQIINCVPHLILQSESLEEMIEIEQALISLGAKCLRTERKYGPSSPDDWLTAPCSEDLSSPSEIYNFLSVRHFQVDEEVKLRVFLFQLCNQPFREAQRWIPISQRANWEHENAMRLLEILTFDNDTHRLLRAEIQRESCNFAEAVRALTPLPEDPRHLAFAKLIIKLSEAGNSQLKMISA